jgi:diguanylate cyclase (GGDEF)-like protein/PAS domain S-box-containing protein
VDNPRRSQALPEAQRLEVLPGGLLGDGAEQALHESQSRHSAILDAAFDGIVTMDQRGLIVDFNRAAETIFGYTREQAVGRPVADLLVPPAYREAHREGLARHLRTGEASVLGRAVELQALRADGTEIDVELALNRVDLPSGPLFTACVRDITDRNAAERELREAEARYRTLVEQLPLIVYIDEVKDGSPNVYTSPQTTAMLGYTPEDWMADPELLEKILHPDDRDRVLAEIRVDAKYGRTFRSEYRLITRDGRTVWVQDESTTISDEDGTPREWQGYLLDITGRKQADADLERLAFSDELTGLANRAMLERRIHEAHALNPASVSALLYLDLDDFKTVNDSLGHEAGDRLLAALAVRLRGMLRPHDTIARIGGDEFALLVGETEAASIAKRVVDGLRTPFTVADHELVITASIGIATGSDPGEMLRNADMAMYEAKGAGGGTFRFFADEMHDAVLNRLQLLADLGSSSFLDQLRVHYQPIFDLNTGAPVGVEALARWEHPLRGIVSPGDFIGLAEETGRILSIGASVLESACAQVAAWSKLRDTPLFASVNVSARQVSRPTFVHEVAEILGRTGLPPSSLVLELTESAVMTGNEVSTQNLHALRGLGTRIAIDDFGTGYSSLAYLAKLAIDVVKIDRSFVDDCDRSPEGLRIVEAITTLGHTLDLTVVAEGIERPGQLQKLRAAGCDEVQGFLLGRPGTADEVEGRLEP